MFLHLFFVFFVISCHIGKHCFQRSHTVSGYSPFFYLANIPIEGGGSMAIQWSELFQFCLVLIGLANLVLQIGKKKWPRRPSTLRSFRSCRGITVNRLRPFYILIITSYISFVKLFCTLSDLFPPVKFLFCVKTQDICTCILPAFMISWQRRNHCWQPVRFFYILNWWS